MAEYSVGAFDLPSNVHFLRRDWFNSNSLLITGSPTILVDSGSYADQSDLYAQLDAHDVQPSSIDLVIATHAHADHVGAIADLQRRFGTRVAMHEYDAYYVNRNDRWATLCVPHANYFPPFRVDVALHEGEVLPLAGLSFRVLHTPGHSYGGISLYCPEHRFLASGDAIWEKAVGVINVRLEGSIAPFLARESVRKLMALDVAVVFPGHGRAILNPAENFQDALSYVQRFLDDPKRMAYDMLWRVLFFNLGTAETMTKDVLLDVVSRQAYFVETNRLFFGLTDAELLQRVLDDLVARGLVTIEGNMVCPVRSR